MSGKHVGRVTAGPVRPGAIRGRSRPAPSAPSTTGSPPWSCWPSWLSGGTAGGPPTTPSSTSAWSRRSWPGNGPVFNAGERVEVATSPLWLFVLTVVDAVVPGDAAPWSERPARSRADRPRRHPRLPGRPPAVVEGRFLGTVPFGVVVFAALPPTWDFTTSGLETGLSFSLARADLLGSRALGASPSGLPPTGRCGCYVTLGIGPLVRPDFAVITGILLLFVVICRRGALVAAGAGPRPRRCAARRLPGLPDGLLRAAGAQHRRGEGVQPALVAAGVSPTWPTWWRPTCSTCPHSSPSCCWPCSPRRRGGTAGSGRSWPWSSALRSSTRCTWSGSVGTSCTPVSSCPASSWPCARWPLYR